MQTNDSISIVIPALNEEKRLADTVKEIIAASKKYFGSYEIIIINDGSTDKTGHIADLIAQKNTLVHVIHHNLAEGLGKSFKDGLKIARNNYFMRVNGKNDITSIELEKIFSLKDNSQVVIPYTINMNDRPVIRRAISKFFTNTLNFISGFNMRYYNHSVLCKREVLNSIKISNDSYAFQAEILIKLLNQGYTYIEVGVTDTFRKDVKTKAFRLKNIYGVVKFLFKIIYLRLVKIQHKKLDTEKGDGLLKKSLDIYHH